MSTGITHACRVSSLVSKGHCIFVCKWCADVYGNILFRNTPHHTHPALDAQLQSTQFPHSALHRKIFQFWQWEMTQEPCYAQALASVYKIKITQSSHKKCCAVNWVNWPKTICLNKGLERMHYVIRQRGWKTLACLTAGLWTFHACERASSPEKTLSDHSASTESVYISGAQLSNPLLSMLGYVAPRRTFLPHTQQSQDMNSKIAPEQ